MELARDGRRREWTLRRGVRALRAPGGRRCTPAAWARGDVVMTLIGNRPEWVLAMCACFRIGAVALPCTEQLRAKDLRLRLEVAQPSLILADERNRMPSCEAAERRGCDGRRSAATSGCSRPPPAPATELAERGPVPDHVHQRHRRRAEGGGARPALPVRPAPAGRALAGRTRRRAGVVHGRHAAGRSRRATCSSRRGCGAPRAAARRPLRPARAPGAARARAGERPVHGAHRVPRDRQARDPASAARTCAGWSPPARR